MSRVSYQIAIVILLKRISTFTYNRRRNKSYKQKLWILTFPNNCKSRSVFVQKNFWIFLPITLLTSYFIRSTFKTSKSNAKLAIRLRSTLCPGWATGNGLIILLSGALQNFMSSFLYPEATRWVSSIPWKRVLELCHSCLYYIYVCIYI